MDTFDIIDDSNKVIILNKYSKRRYLADLNKKIKKHGFSKLNQNEILLNKLKSNDFTYYENLTNLVINFNVTNGKTNYIHELTCDEIFHNINDNIEDMSIDNLKETIISLRYQVKNLTHKLKDKEDELNSIIDNKYYTYEYHE